MPVSILHVVVFSFWEFGKFLELGVINCLIHKFLDKLLAWGNGTVPVLDHVDQGSLLLLVQASQLGLKFGELYLLVL